jgi:hypothetical protein
MSCICQESQKIPTCLDELILGSVSEVNTLVYVDIKNISTGYNYRHSVTTSETGVITLDLSEPAPSFYNQDSYYEIYVSSASHILLPITIDDSEFECIGVYFEKINGLEETTWTLKI